MEQSSFAEPDFSLKEWALKARMISRENTSSRRFSASNLKSFREEARSFRSSMTISSTASSPGYTIREEIDPSTYSFTTALKALQAKAHVYTWEYLSPDGSYTLNSKWNDAEKYISNPLSGEVPLECLSAKTLSGRSFRTVTSRITMSAPLIYPSHNHHFLAKSPITEQENEVEVTPQEKKMSTKRDVGTQSTPTELNSSCPSPTRTLSIEESSVKVSEVEGGDNSSISSGNLKSDTEVEKKETRENQYIKRDEGVERKQKQKQKQHMMCRCRCSISQGGCLSLRALWMRTVLRHRDKHKSKTNNNTTTMPTTFLSHINGCSKE